VPSAPRDVLHPAADQASAVSFQKRHSMTVSHSAAASSSRGAPMQGRRAAVVLGGGLRAGGLWERFRRCWRQWRWWCERLRRRGRQWRRWWCTAKGATFAQAVPQKVAAHGVQLGGTARGVARWAEGVTQVLVALQVAERVGVGCVKAAACWQRRWRMDGRPCRGRR